MFSVEDINHILQVESGKMNDKILDIIAKYTVKFNSLFYYLFADIRNNRINITIQSLQREQTCGMSCNIQEVVFIENYLNNKLDILRK